MFIMNMNHHEQISISNGGEVQRRSGIRPNASGAVIVSPDGKQVGKDFITNLIIIIKVWYLLYVFRISLVCNLETFNVFTFNSICTINEY